MLIPFGQLAAIERRIGPKLDEGVFRIYETGVPVMSGSGLTAGSEVLVDTVAGRVQHIGHLNAVQKMEMGAVRADIDFAITLKARTRVRVNSLIVEIAQDWTGSKYYFAGQTVIPTTETGKLYRCVTAGLTDSGEPTWPDDEGETVVDGAATWRCEGLYRRFDVLEIKGPSTFGQYISTNVFCNINQFTPVD